MRRIHLPGVFVGEMDVPAAEAHHLRDVLRLERGAAVEAFDSEGTVGRGHIVDIGPGGIRIRIERVEARGEVGVELTIAAAVPKGNRADWMIEKLSEMGTDVFVPLVAARSVVVPRGGEKYERWKRLASESAKQCGRAGVMRIDALTSVRMLVDRVAGGEMGAWHLSTGAGARPIGELMASIPLKLAVLVGPEGGWTEEETGAFGAAGILAARLTGTVLRVETAAVAAAAIVESGLTGRADAATIDEQAERKSS